jgi:hypothetical protein
MVLGSAMAIIRAGHMRITENGAIEPRFTYQFWRFESFSPFWFLDDL